MREIEVVDSHTAGEPTRVVVSGMPDLGSGPIAARLDLLRNEFDQFRSAVVNEPRGSDVVVGAMLCEPDDPRSTAGVIFFNNVGYLGMCGHGLIGVITTLHWLGRAGHGLHLIDTPVGTVAATLHADGHVSLVNVPSYRRAKDVEVAVAGGGIVTGDVAWGGNWFYLVDSCREASDSRGSSQTFSLADAQPLTERARKIRRAVNAAGFPEVDHVELFGPATSAGAHSRNFVLCPGGAFDRSPCGTGTSAKLACLAADGKLAPGEPWVQESILGTRFTGTFDWHDREQGIIVPTIAGTAFVNAQGKLLLDDRDPLEWGIRGA
jgi:4-hydroxyproline epimerase